ncbi:MAG: NADH-quinone oxidoreductase subunit N [Alphaproteobacteria bacterium]
MTDIADILFSQTLLPISFLVMAGFFILLTGLYGIFARWSHFFSIMAMLVGLLLLGWGNHSEVNLMVYHPFVLFGWLLVMVATFVVFQLSGRFWQTTTRLSLDNTKTKDSPPQGFFRFEVPVMMLWAVAGLMVMVASGHFVTLYLGLELSSLCFYFLVSINRYDKRASEAALKYYILGAMASAIFLFGASLLYGMTGSLDFATMKDEIDAMLAAGDRGVLSLTLGLLFVIVGIGFKVSAAPFHFWAPDVYQGSLSPITAFFATAPKLAGLVVLGRLLLEYFSALQNQWQIIIAILALLSLVFGAFPALTQNNLKRFIALSGITHVGFLLLALVALSRDETFDSLVFFIGYLLIYLTQIIGLLVVLLGFHKVFKKPEPTQDDELYLSDFAGLSRGHPKLAFGLLLLLFSSAGIPPLLGFFAKWWVLIALVEYEFIGLAVVAVLLSLVSATYYLKIIKTIYMDKPSSDFTLMARQVYSGQDNMLMGFWFWLVVAVQLLAPLFLGNIMAWLNFFRP